MTLNKAGKITSMPLTNQVSLVGGLDASEVQLRFNQSPGFRNTFSSLPISGDLVGTSAKKTKKNQSLLKLMTGYFTLGYFHNRAIKLDRTIQIHGSIKVIDT